MVHEAIMNNVQAAVVFMRFFSRLHRLVAAASAGIRGSRNVYMDQASTTTRMQNVNEAGTQTFRADLFFDPRFRVTNLTFSKITHIRMSY